MAPLAQATEGMVSLSGRIFQPDGSTPYAQATVRVTNQETGQVFTSGPTDTAGRYSFEELPAGTYTFEVEVEEGIYVLDRAVRIGDNESASISFTVKPEPPAPDEKAPMGKKKKRGILIAIITSGAVLLALALDDDDDDDDGVSPFVP
jgi:hypothetical protein